MAAYQTFTSTRTTTPDPYALFAAVRAFDPLTGIRQLGDSWTIKKETDWTPAQIAAVQTIIDTTPEVTPQRLAQGEIDQWPIAMRAFALALVDQINVLRTKAGLATVTPQQALAAIRQKASELV